MGAYRYCVGASTSTRSSGIDRESESIGVSKDDHDFSPATFLDLPEGACVKSSLCHPYYLDDSSFVPMDELMLRQDVELLVSEIGQDTSSDKFAQFIAHAERSTELVNDFCGGNETQFWVLDICLDYFSCTNPFVLELEGIDKDITTLLLHAVQETRFQKSIHVDHSFDGSSSSYESDVSTFRKCVNILLDHFVSELSSDNSISCSIDELLSSHETLFHLYCDPDVAKITWNRLVQSLISWTYKEPTKIRNLVKIIKNAIPNLALPHRDYDDDDSSWNGIEEQVGLFGQSLRRLSYSAPNMITISRSSEDGFTPMQIVEALQTAVLREVRNIYCSREYHCPSSSNLFNEIHTERQRIGYKFNTIFDYGENEGSSFERPI